MRVLQWNCNNGINQKPQVRYFDRFCPDIAILPELKEKNITALSPDSAVWITNNHSNPSPKGLGVLAFNGYELEELPRDEDMEIFIPLKVRKGPFAFNLLAVWNFYYACKQGRFKGVKGENCLEWSALKHYQRLFTDPILVVGDWNFGPTCFQDSYLNLVSILGESGMESLYHTFHALPASETMNATFRTTRQNLHHIDHMFGSRFFLKNMTAFHVDDFNHVVLSDHAPLIVDINI